MHACAVASQLRSRNFYLPLLKKFVDSEKMPVTKTLFSFFVKCRSNYGGEKSKILSKLNVLLISLSFLTTSNDKTQT